MVYYRTNSRKLVWFGMIWLVCPKYHLWGIFPTQFWPKNTNFVAELNNIGLYGFWILPCCLKCKKHSEFQKFIFSIFFLILIQNWYFLAKTEWEKCPISDILDKLTKLFQIRQVWTSLRDNKPWSSLVSKAA